MELVWIEDFLTLERLRNFTAAARARHTTQPAFSRRIANLEQWLGAPLFLRETRPIKLTPSGEEFLPRARRIYEEMMDARRLIQSRASQLPNALRIFTTNTIAIGLLPHWLQKNNIQNYMLVVSSVSACKTAFEDKKCDLAIFPVFSDQDIQNAPPGSLIATDHMVLTIRRDIKARLKQTQTTLSGPLMIYTPGTAYGQFLSRHLEAQHLQLSTPPLCESASAEALLAQVKAGIGAAWVPRSLIQPDQGDLYIDEVLSFPYQIIALRHAPQN